MANKQGNARCCCGATCDCFLCVASNWQCIKAVISGFTLSDLSPNPPPCYHCENLNDTVLLAYHGSGADRCTWYGSYCRPDNPDKFYQSCAIQRVKGELIRTGSVGSYSYKFRLALQAEVGFSSTVTDMVVWEYDWGNLGSELPDCIDGFDLTCDLVTNDLDCEDPNSASVSKHTGTCRGVYGSSMGLSEVFGNCSYCQYIFYGSDFNLPWWVNPGVTEFGSGQTNFQAFGPEFIDISITGVTPQDCPNCEEICDACDEMCGVRPTCDTLEEYGFSCLDYCDGAGWDHPLCEQCWTLYFPMPDCYALHVAYNECVESPEYVACQEECEECGDCIECVACGEPMEYRLVSLNAFSSACGWNRICDTADPICGVSGANAVRVEATCDGATDDFTIVVTLGGTGSFGSGIVKWTKVLTDACTDPLFGTGSVINCLELPTISDGWTFEIIDEDVAAQCIWDDAVLTLTPELPPGMLCQPRPNPLPCCEGPESKWPRYLLITIPDSNWGESGDVNDDPPCANNRCNAAVGEFLLEWTWINNQGAYRYFFAEDMCEGGDVTCWDDQCCWFGITGEIECCEEDDATCVTISLTGNYHNISTGSCSVDPDPPEESKVVTWSVAIPWLYGSEGAMVINCLNIDHDATYLSQTDPTDNPPSCLWLGASIHVEAVVA